MYYPERNYCLSAVRLPIYLAFKNTNGSYVLIIHNNQNVETKRIITLSDKTIAVMLKPQSFNTIVL
jgi:O-glycosyl hydrolase